MKSILFVIPWKASLINCGDIDVSQYIERAPENVVALATYLNAQGARVEIADLNRTLLSCKGDVECCLNLLKQQCQRFNPDIIGLSFFTARFEYAADITTYLRSVFTDKTPLIIAGGVHPTLLPTITYEYINFDALIIGEGELPLAAILKGEPLNQIQGVFLPGQDIPTAADAIKNLDCLPFPNWDLLDKNFYAQPSYLISYTQLNRVMPLSFSRGCMYRCNFCAHSCFLSARCHSPEYFVEMMRLTSKQCNVNSFLIQDSSVGNFKEEWSKVCELLISSKTNYNWWANLRVNQVDEDFLRLLKQAGCSKVFFGFESGSQRILEKMNKKITTEQCYKAAELCHKLDVPFYSSYIVNYFGEEEEDLRSTEEMILQTCPTSLAINKFSPIPGSVDYNKNEDSIKPYLTSIHNWTTLGMLLSPVLFGNMTSERFDYWFKRLKALKNKINNYEDN
ncbi:B12-binding domain-containing radical SAM protein [Bacteroides sp. 519]|uniref:B12-binding domain-containing radical SAM protein n=1 Tax=Bacteroides sp. 519 TaxID=2302937 RepID=UPI0013D3D2EA|nr:radical SAM protein [Bacteroides sp. 519]NDV57278.1 radical SAM protein [Bacteroides sp. 519]